MRLFLTAFFDGFALFWKVALYAVGGFLLVAALIPGGIGIVLMICAEEVDTKASARLLAQMRRP